MQRQSITKITQHLQNSLQKIKQKKTGHHFMAHGEMLEKCNIHVGR